MGDMEFGQLSQDLQEANDAGCEHLVLDFSGCEPQTLQQWTPLRPLVAELTRRRVRLTLEGASPEVAEGLHNATVEARLRNLELQCPDFFSKSS